MLFRTISVQLFLGYILLLLPALFSLLILALSLPHGGAVVTALATAMSLHASLDYFVICYFVVPYRRALMQVVNRIFNRKIPINSGAYTQATSTIFVI